jgi:hypothetical protein
MSSEQRVVDQTPFDAATAISNHCGNAVVSAVNILTMMTLDWRKSAFAGQEANQLVNHLECALRAAVELRDYISKELESRRQK